MKASLKDFTSACHYIFGAMDNDLIERRWYQYRAMSNQKFRAKYGKNWGDVATIA